MKWREVIWFGKQTIHWCKRQTRGPACACSAAPTALNSDLSVSTENPHSSLSEGLCGVHKAYLALTLHGADWKPWGLKCHLAYCLHWWLTGAPRELSQHSTPQWFHWITRPMACTSKVRCWDWVSDAGMLGNRRVFQTHFYQGPKKYYWSHTKFWC